MEHQKINRPLVHRKKKMNIRLHEEEDLAYIYNIKQKNEVKGLGKETEEA